MPAETPYNLETLFHDDEKILEVRFAGDLSRESIAEVFEAFRDRRFSMEHSLLVDLSKANLHFSIADVKLVADAIEHNPPRRPQGARTAWIIGSHTDTEIVRLAREFAPRWKTVWKFLNDRPSAIRWLNAPEEGEVDFGPENFRP